MYWTVPQQNFLAALWQKKSEKVRVFLQLQTVFHNFIHSLTLISLPKDESGYIYLSRADMRVHTGCLNLKTRPIHYPKCCACSHFIFWAKLITCLKTRWIHIPFDYFNDSKHCCCSVVTAFFYLFFSVF